MDGSALHQMDSILQKHGGRQPDTAFTVRVPCNFVPLYDPPQGKKKEEVLTLANELLVNIAGTIDTGLIVRPGISPFTSLLKHFMYEGFIKICMGLTRIPLPMKNAHPVGLVPGCVL